MRAGDTGQELTADELDAYQRRLLAKALAVILSPEWGKKSKGPDDGQGKGQDVEN